VQLAEARLLISAQVLSGLILQINMELLTLTCKSKGMTMRITSKGQVTIPVEIRERAGLLPQTEVEFEFDGKDVRIVRAKAHKSASRGARLVAHLRGRGDVAMSTEAIMALTRDD
jgi:AbrB family looped-hinge helix DNA binding protein